MRNIEFKAHLRDRAAVEMRLAELGAELVWTRHQRDTFFEAPLARLKLRVADGAAPELIAYVRSDRGAARPSDWTAVEVPDAEAFVAVVGRALPVEAVVDKQRTLWMHGHTRVHLDRVEGLGDFLELETVLDGIDEQAGLEECEALREALGIRAEDLVALPYRDLPRGAALPGND